MEFAERIVHVDMDAFFVEVERLRRPELRGRPVVVGGTGTRGVVASASYEARRHGIRSAMPTVHARRLCPGAVFVPPDHTAYGAASRSVFAVLRSFTPVVEGLSVDEAFLDVAGLRRHHPSPEAVGIEIRARLRREVGLPASVGIATSKLVAKLASEQAKPDGILLVAAGTEREFLHPLPARALWGVGEATFARLEELGVVTVGDIAAMPRDLLERRLGSSLGSSLWRLSAAEDDRPVRPGGGAKTVSVEHTYAQDLSDQGVIEAELLRHAHRLGGRMRDAGLAARTVTLKVRFADFATVSRSETFDTALDTAHDLFDAARRLLGRVGRRGRPVRLLGLGAGALEEAAAPRQLALGDKPWDRIEAAVDRVRGRFGDGIVGPARLADRPERDAPGRSPSTQ